VVVVPVIFLYRLDLNDITNGPIAPDLDSLLVDPSGCRRFFIGLYETDTGSDKHRQQKNHNGEKS
jgi:hypothetical protein